MSHHTQALLDCVSGLTGCPLAILSTAGRPLAWSGPIVPCEGCPGPLEDGCRLFSRHGDGGTTSCQQELEFLSVAIPGQEGFAGNLVAVKPRCDRNGEVDAERSRGQLQLAQSLQGLAEVIGELTRERADLDLMSLELSTRYEELNLIYGVSQRLTRGGDLHDVLQYIIEESMSTTSGEWALLYLQKRNIIEVGGWAGGTGAGNRQSMERLAETILREISAGDLKPLTSPQRSGSEVEAALGTPVDLLAVPILKDRDLEGFLAVAHLSNAVSFSTSDTRMLQALSGQVSLVVTNWELHASLREFLMSTVRSLVSAIDAKDAYTRGHSERVHRLSLLLGEALALDPVEYQTLHWASLLHDIGKLGVPESILGKPGALTDEEFAVMKRHPDRSCEIISHITQLAPALDAIRHHHEKWDGSGYPAGLRADLIPRLARIISVADTFDALTSDRAYRGALPVEEVRRYIKSAAGRQLDPEVVAAFDAIFPQFARIATEAKAAFTEAASSKEESHGDHPVPQRAADADRGLAAAR